MVKEEYLSTHNSSRETDREVAREVMGFFNGRISRYTSDISAAWSVVDKLVSFGLFVSVISRGGNSSCTLSIGQDDLLDMCCRSPELAICHAAIHYVRTYGKLSGLREFLDPINEDEEDSS